MTNARSERVTTRSRQYVLGKLRLVAIWFLVLTVIIHLYADPTDPMPVSLVSRLLIALGIVAIASIPLVRKIGRIYRDTPPDDGDLDE